MAEFKFSSRRSDAGFSLVEVMVATMLLAVALTSIAQLMVIATRSNQSAQRLTFASTLAQEKMEQLRGLAWGFDDMGLPMNDLSSDITVDPPTINGGVGLRPSPDNSLSSNQVGYVDYVDRFGNTLGGGANPLANTAYVRRWSVEPLPTNPNNTVILQVLVFNVRDRANTGSGAVTTAMRDEVRLVSVKTRKSR